ncbi:MAG: AlpA family phage regulatory protein [Rhizobacter sp.]|nr:AlpA family phage regulatory protein [Rhizobacter sp.]
MALSASRLTRTPRSRAIDQKRTSRPQNATADLPPTGFVRLPTVLHLVPVSASAWWAGIQAGRYPKGVKLSPRVTAWSVESIRELVASLNSSKEARDE